MRIVTAVWWLFVGIFICLTAYLLDCMAYSERARMWSMTKRLVVSDLALVLALAGVLIACLALWFIGGKW